MVTATLAPAGVGWPAISCRRRWTRQSATKATYQVVFDSGVVHAGGAGGAGGDPGDVCQRCGDGADDRRADTTGSSMWSTPAGPYDGTKDTSVTVTATVQAGFGWGTITRRGYGWMTRRRRLTVTLARVVVCERVPVAPTVTQAVCVRGVVSPPTLVLPGPTASRTRRIPVAPYLAGAVGDGDGDAGGGGGRLAGAAAVGVDSAVGDEGDVSGDVRCGVVYAGGAGGAGGDPGDVCQR